MQFNNSNYNLENPEFWLIIVSYAGFWLYSYYSLIVRLIHTRKQNRIMENE